MIGEEVRRHRQELGLTGAQLAARAGMAPSAVSQIETGKRTPNSTSVIKLAAALGLEAGDLLPKGQTPLPLDAPTAAVHTDYIESGEPFGSSVGEDSQGHAGGEATEGGPYYNAFETLGRVLAMGWKDDLEKWNERIPDGTSPDLMEFGRLLQWVLEIGGTREVYKSIAERERSFAHPDQLEDTLRLLEEAEREAVAKLKRAFEPAKTYAEFQKIVHENDLEAILESVESGR